MHTYDEDMKKKVKMESQDGEGFLTE